MTSDLCDMTTPTTRSTAHKRTRIVAIMMLCIGLSIAMVTCILRCSGDVETNPGPGCEYYNYCNKGGSQNSYRRFFSSRKCSLLTMKQPIYYNYIVIQECTKDLPQ